MTWPVTPVSTANLDAGTDEPRLARADIKQAVDNINAIAAEFGNVSAASATNDQILVKSGNVWSGTNTITNLDLLDFDTAAALTPTAGQMTWDAAQGTVQLALTNNVITRIGQDLVANVTNADSVTINKGQPVYHFGAQGDRASVKLASNATDATSAKTFGIAAENIAAGQSGMIVCQGILTGVDTSAYNAGDTLYLGATAGTITTTKPRAPNHMVYLGTVSRANAGAGIIFVKVQNGYELDEIHDANITNPVGGQVLQYSGNLWINANLALDNLSDVTISSPTTNQTLQYNGSQWVNANVSTAGTSTQYLQMNTTFFNAFGDTSYTQINTTYTELAAGSVTTTGNVMVFGTGTYIIELDSLLHVNVGGSTSENAYYVELYNNSDSAQIGQFNTFRTGDVSGPVNFGVGRPWPVKLTVTGTKNIIIRHRVASGVTATVNWAGGIIKITKIA